MIAELVWWDSGAFFDPEVPQAKPCAFEVGIDEDLRVLSDKTFRFVVAQTSLYTLSCYDDCKKLLWEDSTRRALVAGQTLTAVGLEGHRLDKLDWKAESLYLNEVIRGLRSTIKDLEAMG